MFRNALVLWVGISLAAGMASAAKTPVELPKPAKGWEFMTDDDGVLVHRMEVPGSDVVAFRGEKLMHSPISKVASVLIDTSRKLEWVAKCAEAKDIRKIDEHTRIEYNATYSGFFLVKDREFVFKAWTELQKDKNRLLFKMQSVDEPGLADTGRVRGTLDKSRYILTRVDENTTHVVVEIHADPRGSVPKWLVNLFQKSWPTTTLNNIAKQAAKPDVKPNAEVEKAFAPTAEKAVVKASAEAAPEKG